MALQNYIQGISVEQLKTILEKYEYRYSINDYTGLFKIEDNRNYIELFRKDLDALTQVIIKDIPNIDIGTLTFKYYGVLEICEKDYSGHVYNTIYMNDDEMYKLLTNINKYYKYVVSDDN